MTWNLGPCVEWQGDRLQSGYGRVGTRKYGTRRAHRVAWIQAFGEIPKGLLVLHRCDNPPCVNPEHLFLGTDADNTRDAFEKGRRAAPDNGNTAKTHCPRCGGSYTQGKRKRRCYACEKSARLSKAVT